MRKASLVRRGVARAEHTSFRRMTKYEYNYALQDLLGSAVPSRATVCRPRLRRKMASRTARICFRCHLMQFEAYRELGLKALRASDRDWRSTCSCHLPHLDVRRDGESRGWSRQEENVQQIRRRATAIIAIGRICSTKTTGDGIQYNGRRRKALEAGEYCRPSIRKLSPVVLVLPRSQRVEDESGSFSARRRDDASEDSSGTYDSRSRTSIASLRLIFSAHTSNNANFSQVISPARLCR
jgi:hypothetical protein